MDGLTLTKAVNILRQRYIGAQAAKLNVTESGLSIGLFTSERSALNVRVTGGSPTIYLSDDVIGVKDPALDRLSGGKISDIGCRRYDRLFYINIAKRRPSGKIETHRLIFELIGKMANVCMVNEAGNIIWLFCKNNADGDRDFSVGAKYAQPRLNKQQTLDKYSGKDFNDLLGFYPVTAKHADQYVKNNYSFDETAALIRESLSDEIFYRDAQGRIIPFRPFGESEEIRIEDLSAGAVKMSVKKESDIRPRLTRFFEKQAEKYLRLKDQLLMELKEAEKFPETRRMADLLKANLHVLKNARGSVSLDEYTSDGIVKVPYDIPELFDPNHEVNRLYRKADKQERSVGLLHGRMQEIDNIIDSALEQLYYIEISASDDELRELALEMKRSEPKKKQQIKEKQFIKIDVGAGTAYIGRNSVSNHRLVFQFANPNDWWFHAQKTPSAHLIFRKDGNITPDETEMCAAITAGMSKRKTDLKVTVDYTQKKNVKKPKNTPPGFVIYHRFKSVIAEPVFLDENTLG
ncbi:MAG: NFACT RNA binding domain-containing protein [Deferribacterales bacterium]